MAGGRGGEHVHSEGGRHKNRSSVQDLQERGEVDRNDPSDPPVLGGLSEKLYCSTNTPSIVS